MGGYESLGLRWLQGKSLTREEEALPSRRGRDKLSPRDLLSNATDLRGPVIPTMGVCAPNPEGSMIISP